VDVCRGHTNLGAMMLISLVAMTSVNMPPSWTCYHAELVVVYQTVWALVGDLKNLGALGNGWGVTVP